MKPAVTVIVPSYNPGHYLREALAGVMAQTYHGWELVLVDDASTDDSLSQAREYLGSPKVRVIHSRTNVGQGQAQNIALGEVKTPWVVQLDADDWFKPRTLEVLAGAAASADGEVGVIAGNFRTVVEDRDGRAVRTYLRRGRPFRDRYEFLVEGTTICPRFYRTSALRHIGGWPTDDPYQGRHMEDLLVLFRLIEHYRFEWVDEVLYVHRRHGGNNSMRTEEYVETLEWAVGDALKRWGDRYRPVFETIGDGWKRVAHLEPKDAGSGDPVILPSWYEPPPRPRVRATAVRLLRREAASPVAAGRSGPAVRSG